MTHSTKTRLAVAGALVASLALALPAGASSGASSGAKLAFPSVDLGLIAPADPGVAAMLPRGPQHMVITFTIKGASSQITESASGYINFTKGDQAGCSSDVVETTTLSPDLRVRQVRDPHQPAYQTAIAGAKKYLNGSKLNKYYEFGPNSKAPSTGVFFVPAGAPELLGTELTSGTGDGWCMFDELSRYATFIQGSSGALRINIAAVTLLGQMANNYSLIKQINAADFPTEQSAILDYYALSRLTEPLYSGVYDAWHLTLTRSGSVVTLVNNQATKPGTVFKTTVAFTPTTIEKVPSVTGESLINQEFGSAARRAEFRNNNLPLS